MDSVGTDTASTYSVLKEKYFHNAIFITALSLGSSILVPFDSTYFYTIAQIWEYEKFCKGRNKE